MNPIVMTGDPHPGLTFFELNNALTYFNKERILRESLEGDENLEFYLEDKNIFFSIERIYDTHCRESNLIRSGYGSPYSKEAEASLPEKDNLGLIANTVIDNEAQTDVDLTDRSSEVIKRLRLNLSLEESEDSICVSLPKGSPKRCQQCCENVLTDVPKQHEKKSSPTYLVDVNPPEKSQTEDTTGVKDGSEKNKWITNTEELIEAEDGDLGPLFWLMSILPEPQAMFCKQVLDRDAFFWKISFCDIIGIFVNWGASKEILRLEDLGLSLKRFQNHMPSSFSLDMTSENTFPRPTNVSLVLSSICQRLPPEPQLPFRDRAMIIRILVFAALDKLQRCNISHFCRTISKVLDSFQDWDENKAAEFVKELNLGCLDWRNFVFVCCCLFRMTSDRDNLMGMLVAHDMLHAQFGLPAEPSLNILVQHLPKPSATCERFSLGELAVITQLLNTLLSRHAFKTPPCSEETVTDLYKWSNELRLHLSVDGKFLNLECAYVRERLSQVTLNCANIVRDVFHTSIIKDFTSNMNYSDIEEN